MLRVLLVRLPDGQPVYQPAGVAEQPSLGLVGEGDQCGACGSRETSRSVWEFEAIPAKSGGKGRSAWSTPGRPARVEVIVTCRACGLSPIA